MLAGCDNSGTDATSLHRAQDDVNMQVVTRVRRGQVRSVAHGEGEYCRKLRLCNEVVFWNVDCADELPQHP
jgi:hypothetical protein